MKYRLDKNSLLDILQQWNRFLKKRVHLIACGGTALTLLDVKPSTKDVDFMVPVASERTYLIKTLEDLGYENCTTFGWKRTGDVFIFDLFCGNRIHTTELLESPLQEGNHQLLMRFSHLYIGILNNFDLIASKLIRGSSVDFQDCTMLIRARRDKISIESLVAHCREIASYDVAAERVGKHIDYFIEHLREENLYE